MILEILNFHPCIFDKKPMSCKPGIAGLIHSFSIKPLSVSLRVLLSYNKHTYHKPSRPSTGYYPWKSHKMLFCFFAYSISTKILSASSFIVEILKFITMSKENLSHDIVSGSDITPCNKINKPLVVYRFCNFHFNIA